MTWRPDRRVRGRVVATVARYGVQVIGDSRAELDEQVRLAILSRGGDPSAGIRWRQER